MAHHTCLLHWWWLLCVSLGGGSAAQGSCALQQAGKQLVGRGWTLLLWALRLSGRRWHSRRGLRLCSGQLLLLLVLVQKIGQQLGLQATEPRRQLLWLRRHLCHWLRLRLRLRLSRRLCWLSSATHHGSPSGSKGSSWPRSSSARGARLLRHLPGCLLRLLLLLLLLRCEQLLAQTRQQRVLLQQLWQHGLQQALWCGLRRRRSGLLLRVFWWRRLHTSRGGIRLLLLLLPACRLHFRCLADLLCACSSLALLPLSSVTNFLPCGLSIGCRRAPLATLLRLLGRLTTPAWLLSCRLLSVLCQPFL